MMYYHIIKTLVSSIFYHDSHQQLIILTFLTAMILKIGSCFYIQPDVIGFTEHPRSQVTLENSSLTLRCAIDSLSLDHSLPALPFIKWQYNDQDLTSCANNTEYSESMIVSICVIESINVNDIGWYRCAAVDGHTNCTVSPCYPTITMSNAAYVLVLGEFNESDSDRVNVIEVESNCSTVYLLPFEIPFTESLSVDGVDVDFDMIWEKDGLPISNTSEVMVVLPSRSLLLNSIQDGSIYTCISGNGVIINKYQIKLNDSLSSISFIPSSVSLTVIQSYSASSSSTESISIDSNGSGTEFICQVDSSTADCVTSSHNIPLVSWTYNGELLVLPNNESGQNNWLRYDIVTPVGNYCCLSMGNTNSHSCVTISTKVNHPAVNNSTSYLETPADNEIITVSINCTGDTRPSNDSGSNHIDWYYNGDLLIEDSGLMYSVMVSGWNVTSIYGIYQCLLTNTSHLLQTHRILPFGLTNPPSYVSLFLPIPSEAFEYGTHIISCTPPLYTGGLTTAQLKYKLEMEVVNAIDENSPYYTCTMQTYDICNITCQMFFIDDDQDGYRVKDGYRVIQLKVVDGDGNDISQLSTPVTISTYSCNVYVPAPPVVSLLCTTNTSALTWMKSDLAYLPDVEHTVVTLRCFSNGTDIIEEHLDITASPTIEASTIHVTNSLVLGDACTYTAYVHRFDPSCSGHKTINSCTITPTKAKTTATQDYYLSSTPLYSEPIFSSMYYFMDPSSAAIHFTSSLHAIPVPLESSDITTDSIATITYNSIGLATDTPSNTTTALMTQITVTSVIPLMPPTTSTTSTSTSLIPSSIITSSIITSKISTVAPESDANTQILSTLIGLVTALICLLGIMVACIVTLFVTRNRWKKSRAIIDRSLSFDIGVPTTNDKNFTELHIEVDTVSHLTNFEALVANYNDQTMIRTSNGDLIYVLNETVETAVLSTRSSEHEESKETDTTLLEGAGLGPTIKGTNDPTMNNNADLINDTISATVVSTDIVNHNNTADCTEQLQATTSLTMTRAGSSYYSSSGSDVSHKTSSSAYSSISSDSSSGCSFPSDIDPDSSSDYVGIGGNNTAAYPRHMRTVYNPQHPTSRELLSAEQLNLISYNSTQHFPTILEEGDDCDRVWLHYETTGSNDVTSICYDDEYCSDSDDQGSYEKFIEDTV